ncbi:MAG: hypothetical protein QY312_02055 [Candidatus Dojkabacteria bacterium]|nr:MAG: hypothetical protein QY312_02055 [Candidatus Dojkabacteria bacterium]
MVRLMKQGKPHNTKSEVETLIGPFFEHCPEIQQAFAQSCHTHRYQRRDDNSMYLEQHIFPLVFDMYRYFDRVEEKVVGVAVALLHDVPEEDPNCRIDRIYREYSPHIADCVAALQKQKKTTAIRKQADKHEEHIALVKTLANAPKIAQVMKVFDRLNNLVCTEMKRNIIKYERFILDTELLYLPFAYTVDVNLAEKMKKGLTQLKGEFTS